jgi:hypothetical protein
MTADKSTMLAVYSGQRCLGFILQRGQRGYEAFDVNDVSLGTFATDREAAIAVSERAQQQ